MRSATPVIEVVPATPAGVPLILAWINDLAAYERQPEAVVATEPLLQAWLFGPDPAAEAAVAYLDGEPAGYALWFRTFSTWLGRPGLWLEDLYVPPALRRRGVGTALLRHVARLARERGYGRVEWSALDWNDLAIDFYRGLGALRLDEWTTYRLDGPALADLAGL